MAQHDYAIANGSGATVRADINDALEALVSTNSGATEPATTYAYMLWADTTAALLKIRDSTNAAWVTIGPLDTTGLGLGSTLPGHLFGLTLSNGTDATNDIDIAIGQASSNDAAVADRVLMTRSAALTKRLDAAWAVGTNEGGRDTGDIANTTYHVFLIQRPDTGVVDALFSESPTSPTMPANYTKKRRIGSILRESATIVPFLQDGDDFFRYTPIRDISAANPGTAAVTRTLSVPLGLNVFAVVNARISAVNATIAYLSDLSIADDAPHATNAPLGNLEHTEAAGGGKMGTFRIRTNTSAQIRSRISASDANTTLAIVTVGWIDKRQ